MAIFMTAATLTTLTTAFSIYRPSPMTMMTPAYLTTRTLVHQHRRNHFSSRLSLSPSSTLTSSSSSSSSSSKSLAIIPTSLTRVIRVLFPPSSSIGSSIIPFSYALSLQLLLFATFRSKLLTMLTPSGYIHALALGTILWSTLGYKGWTVCVLYLLLGQLVTKIGFQTKTKLGIAEGRGGRRGPENVWGSAAAGTICTLAAAAAASSSSSTIFLGLSREVWILGYIASLSTKLADTFASEIGKAYGQTTFLITSLKPVPRGTEGAISLEGTVASIVGGLLLSTYAYFVVGLLPSIKSVVVSTVAAFIATMIESVIGATLQGKKGMSWMTNEVVNFINTVIGAVVAMSLGVLLLGM